VRNKCNDCALFSRQCARYGFMPRVSGVQWENECNYETASVAEFKDWLMGQCQPNNPLQKYECNKHWCYADYKYMAKLFATKPDILKVLSCMRTKLSYTCGYLFEYMLFNWCTNLTQKFGNSCEYMFFKNHGVVTYRYSVIQFG